MSDDNDKLVDHLIHSGVLLMLSKVGADLGLTLNEFIMLNFLKDKKTPSQVSERFKIRLGSTSKRVGLLHKRGLLDITHDKFDRRCVYYVASEEGHKQLEEFRLALARTIKSHFKK